MFPLCVASVQQSFISSLFVEVMVSSSWHLAIVLLVFWNAGVPSVRISWGVSPEDYRWLNPSDGDSNTEEHPQTPNKM